MAAPQPKVDRQTTTPFLLRLFYKTGIWHRLDDFSANGPLPTHVQIYTWQSCSLRELTHLLTSAIPSLLPSPAAGTRVAFRLVYPDTRAPVHDPSQAGRYLSKELGSVVIGASDDAHGPSENGESQSVLNSLQGDADKTLQDARFVIGDYVSCAIIPPLPDGAVAPPPAAPGGPPMRGSYNSRPPRSTYGSGENGFGRGRGSRGGGYSGDFPPPRGVPAGEWRRGERIPDRSYSGTSSGGGGGGYRGRGRGRAW